MYRPFALLAFGASIGGGTPLGVWMLAWLYLGAPAVGVEWLLLHAHLQIFGLFGTLIPGVAQHLLARFTGRPVKRHPAMRWLPRMIAVALVLRVAGTWEQAPVAVAVAALLQSAVYVVFTWWVWRSLDPPPLALLRRQLTLSSGWLAVACLLEAVLRWRGLVIGLAVPALGPMRVAHAMAFLGGVIGWVLGVLLRAGPMFIAGWRAPLRFARAVGWLLALAVALVAAGEAEGVSLEAATALSRLGDFVALATVGGVLLLGGAARRGRGALPMVARSAEETRIFRLAAASAATAALAAPFLAAAAWRGVEGHVLADGLRHLITVGFLTSVVVAMTFRLIPVLESRPLPWPRLRTVAFWALLAGVLLRSAEVLVGLGGPALGRWVPLSGVLVWIALGSVGANLLRAIAGAGRYRAQATGPAPSA